MINRKRRRMIQSRKKYEYWQHTHILPRPKELRIEECSLIDCLKGLQHTMTDDEIAELAELAKKFKIMVVK